MIIVKFSCWQPMHDILNVQHNLKEEVVKCERIKRESEVTARDGRSQW